jgi:hypothetical protein
MGYGAMVTLHGAMGYGAMVLHDAENCNEVMALCDHGVLANGAMQYNHCALRLGAVQKGQIIIFLLIRFILCLSFTKGSVSVGMGHANANDDCQKAEAWRWSHGRPVDSGGDFVSGATRHHRLI